MVLYALWAYDLERFEHFKLLHTIQYSIWLLLFDFKTSQNKRAVFNLFSNRFAIGFFICHSKFISRFLSVYMGWAARILSGLNPYLTTPNDLMISQPDLFPQMKLLFDGMGPLSAGHYSNYPPYTNSHL